MKKLNIMKIALIVLLVFLFTASFVITQDSVGTVVSIQGKVSAERGGKVTALKFKDPVFKGDILVSDKGGKAKILFHNESTVTISENSRIQIKDAAGSKDSKTRTTTLHLINGIGRFVAGKKFLDPGSKFEVTTPTSVAGVRSTDFFGIHRLGKTIFVTVEGLIGAKNILSELIKEVLVAAMQQTDIETGKAPSDVKPVDQDFLNELLKSVEIKQGAKGMTKIVFTSNKAKKLFQQATGATEILLASTGLNLFDTGGYIQPSIMNAVNQSGTQTITQTVSGDMNGSFSGGFLDAFGSSFSVSGLNGNFIVTNATDPNLNTGGSHSPNLGTGGTVSGSYSGSSYTSSSFTGGSWTGKFSGPAGGVMTGTASGSMTFSSFSSGPATINFTASGSGKPHEYGGSGDVTTNFTGGTLNIPSSGTGTVTGGSITYYK